MLKAAKGRQTMDPSTVTRLANWCRRPLPDEAAVLVRESLEEVSALVNADRALMAWEEPEEPWLHLALLDSGNFRWTEQPPAKFEPLVHDDLDGSFACRDASAQHPVVISNSATVRELHVAPLHALLIADFAIRSVASARIDGETAAGRLFALDVAIDDSAALLEPLKLAGAIVASRLDHAARIRNAGREAVMHERFRVARDLHDGLLQSFTGVVLQLEAVHGILEEDPARARKTLTEVESMIMTDQRELRSYLEQLRPHPPRREPEFDLSTRLNEFILRFERQWQCRIAIRFGDIDPVVAQALGWETYRIITEAVTNSARHGEAENAGVELSTREDRLRIVVSDDGHGFPFRGRYNLSSLIEQHIGPTSLCERIAALNGDMVLDSTDAGSLLEIEIPVGWRSD